jgi:DNA invertase Pin-like site-specific DNA recombinase
MLVSRMVHGKKAAQASGAAWGGPPPFGFVYAPTQDGTLLPVEDEVKIALKMIKMKKDGATQRGIADALNAEKLLPKSGRVITRTTVHHVLSKASRFMALRDIDVGVAGASR